MTNSVARVELLPDLQLTGTAGQVRPSTARSPWPTMGASSSAAGSTGLRDSRVEFSAGPRPGAEARPHGRDPGRRLHRLPEAVRARRRDRDLAQLGPAPGRARSADAARHRPAGDPRPGRRLRSDGGRGHVGRRAGLRRTVPRLRRGGGGHHRRSRARVERRRPGAAAHGVEAARQPLRARALRQPRRQRADVGRHLPPAAGVRVPRRLARTTPSSPASSARRFQFGPGVSPPRATARRQVARDRVAGGHRQRRAGLRADRRPLGDLAAQPATSSTSAAGWRTASGSPGSTRNGGTSPRASSRPGGRSTGAAGEPRVALDYRITRGPRTVLSVAGYSPAPDAAGTAAAGVGRQRAAWTCSTPISSA